MKKNTPKDVAHYRNLHEEQGAYMMKLLLFFSFSLFLMGLISQAQNSRKPASAPVIHQGK